MEQNITYAIDQYKLMWKNGLNFEGRISRRAFWNVFLVNIIITVIINFVIHSGLLALIAFVYSIAVIIPTISLSTRRLHDIGKSGWAQLILIIPLIGAILFLMWSLTKGDEGTNAYGVNPETPNNVEPSTPDFGSGKEPTTPHPEDSATPTV